MRKANTISFVENSGERSGEHPWNADHIREDVWKPVVFRRSEPEYLKVKYICEQDRVTMQELFRKAVTSVVNTRVLELTR